MSSADVPGSSLLSAQKDIPGTPWVPSEWWTLFGKIKREGREKALNYREFYSSVWAQLYITQCMSTLCHILCFACTCVLFVILVYICFLSII